jgi:cytoskeletal protein RodZ
MHFFQTLRQRLTQILKRLHATLPARVQSRVNVRLLAALVVLFVLALGSGGVWAISAMGNEPVAQKPQTKTESNASKSAKQASQAQNTPTSQSTATAPTFTSATSPSQPVATAVKPKATTPKKPVAPAPKPTTTYRYGTLMLSSPSVTLTKSGLARVPITVSVPAGITVGMPTLPWNVTNPPASIGMDASQYHATGSSGSNDVWVYRTNLLVYIVD